jgi:putative holliday junction resolvase
MRVFAVDPGLKKIGTAVSDPTGMVARALKVIPHASLPEDAEQILRLSEKEGAQLIVIGIQHRSGEPATPITRFTHRLMAALRAAATVPVILADESFSTQTAKAARIERGEGRMARRRADDALAAAAILQEYLDAHIES